MISPTSHLLKPSQDNLYHLERNTRSRNKLKLLHALGKKSLARKAYDMMGREPSRVRFLLPHTRSDRSFVCDEARICVDKLNEVMNQNTQKEATSNESGTGPYKDDFAQVFGPEQSGRVRCVRRGPTPSKYFQSLESESSMKSEITGLMSQMEGLKDKVNIVADGKLGGSTKHNINLPQIISLLSQAKEIGNSKDQG